MSSLARYLAPQRPPRPNPGYKVEWRHGEGGPWSPLDPTQPQGVPKGQVPDLLASPLVSLVQGDLGRVLDTKGRVVGFSVMTGGRLVPLPSGGGSALFGRMHSQDMRVWAQALGHDWEKAWENCVRADWLFHLATRVGVDPRLLVLAACDCAETALRYVPAGEDRPRLAIETARRGARGEASEEEVHAAWKAASDAASEASGDTAADAAVCAARDAAGCAAEDEGWEVVRDAARAAANYAARDNFADTEAAWEAAWTATWNEALRSMAVLVRQRIPLWQFALALAAKVPG